MNFIFNGINSIDLGLRVKNFTFDTLPSRKISTINIDKRNGNIYKDFGTFNTSIIDVEILLVDNFTPEQIVKVKSVFKSGVGQLELSHKPNNIYNARIMNAINFVEMLTKTGQCLISFEVEPFSYLKSGQTYREITSGDILVNEGNYASLPLYRVEGTGNMSITVNNKVMSFYNVSKPFIVDTLLEDVYGIDNSNLNSYMEILSDFEGLQEGENVITFSGASKLEVMPNWREI